MILKKNTSKKPGKGKQRQLTHVVAKGGALVPYNYQPKSKKSRLIEVRVFLPDDDSKETPGEWVWAKRIRKNICEIRNTPYLVFGLAWGDHVRIEDRDGMPTVVEVIKRSGESSYYISGKKGQPNSEVEAALNYISFWFDCRFERIVGNCWALGASTDTNLDQLESLLRKKKSEGLWDFSVRFRFGSKLNKAKSRFLWAPGER